MTTTAKSKTSVSDREMVITRHVKAPRDRVWEAWTDAKHLAKWWGPNGFSTTISAFEFKIGGVWQFVMHGPDGRDYPSRVEYTQIKKPERLEYHHVAADGSGAELFASTVTFEAKDGGTFVTLRVLMPSVEALEVVKREHKAEEGGRQTLGRLATYAEGAEEAASLPSLFSIERVFDAPRNLVWQAHSQAGHLQNWWGPKGCKLDVKALEFRPGGMFHYRMSYSTGAEMWGRFFYREIERNERIVWLNSFSNEGGGITRAPFSADCPLEMANTLVFSEQNGKTTLALRSSAFGATPAEEQYYADLKPSLAQGYGGTLDQLETYLTLMAAS